MAKFLNKKKQVFDLKLTPYGKYLLSVGTFKPVFYAFYDDNVLYDGAYAGITEKQNDIQKRIKKDTQYLEGIVRDSAADNYTTGSVTEDYFELDLVASQKQPEKSTLKYEIGDAYLEGDTQAAPAWKAVALNGRISGSHPKDNLNDIHAPQINVKLKYSLKVESPDITEGLLTEDLRYFINTSQRFKDNRVVRLYSDDLMLYLDEVNTELLTENFDIEVFLIDSGSVPSTIKDGTPTDSFNRKYFLKDLEKLQDGMYVPPNESENYSSNVEYNDHTVKYYFDILTDNSINENVACKSAQIFNKNSYYVNLDFDCADLTDQERVAVDIYGVVTEPEICQ